MSKQKCKDKNISSNEHKYSILLKDLDRQTTQASSSVDTSILKPPPPDTILWVSLFLVTLAAFVVGLTGLLTPNYMRGEINMTSVKPMVSAFLRLPDDYEPPDILTMADFGLFKFCFSDDFMIIVNAAMKIGDAEIPEIEGGMKLDFSKKCHQVVTTENQPEVMKLRTRQGKILMFTGLSSVFITWLFLILVLVAGRHLSKVISAISAVVAVSFLVSSLLVSMTLKTMTKDYLNLEIMRSTKISLEAVGFRVEFLKTQFGIDLEALQPVEIEVKYSGFLIATSAIMMMVVGVISLFKTRSHRPG